jgi:hypothetical protein
MKSIIIILASVLVSTICASQSPLQTVNDFFKAMNKCDTVSLKNLFIDKATLHSSFIGVDGNSNVSSESLQDFINSIGKEKKGNLDEQIYNMREEKGKGVASVMMDYDFFYKGKFSHCGTNQFTLIEIKNKWKISDITDTRTKQNCKGDIATNIEKFLDEWHMAATNADSAAYFSKMADNSIFIGTDSFEVWTKSQFIEFAAPHFKKGKAWDFKKTIRNIHIDIPRNMVWFDEMLATWMGPCRGSGWIDISDKNNFQLVQYVLSTTVPNEKIDKFLEAMRK